MGCGVTIYDDSSIVNLAIMTTPDNTRDDFLRSSINDVHKLSVDLFRNKLIDYFDILFKKTRFSSLKVVKKNDNNNYRTIILSI